MGIEVKTVKRWLITGGCGFIGTALIRRILADEPQAIIRVLDNLSVGTREDLERVAGGQGAEGSGRKTADGRQRTEDSGQRSARVELVVGDVRDADVCLRAAKGVNVIVHLAANTGVGPSVEDPLADMETNVRGILNMLEAARNNGVSRFIFSSSGAPVGEVAPPIHEEMAAKPVSPYGASKLAGEGYCSAYFRSFGVETVALRFGNVYGPGSGRKFSVVAKFIKQALEGESCEIYGDGRQTRDFIFIEDLLGAILKAAGLESEINVWGEVFQIATSREHTLNELVQILGKELKEQGVSLETNYGSARLGDVKRNYSDTSKAARILGWSAEVSLEEGIKRTVAWFLGR
jgi:UDP-glucose 4-epimerase